MMHKDQIWAKSKKKIGMNKDLYKKINNKDKSLKLMQCFKIHLLQKHVILVQVEDSDF